MKNNLKRGKGSQRVSGVAVSTESIAYENIETGELSNQSRYFKLQKLNRAAQMR
jgi:hypothetical protein